jgi:hypothetical protein
MEFYRLTGLDDALFKKAFYLYTVSFPEHEQRLFENQLAALNNPEYHCEIVLEKGEFVGIIFYWETAQYTYIEHFAIDPDKRGNSVDSRCLKKFCDRHNLVILEIDPPVDSISIRRKDFHLRLGFHENKYQHYHPAYRKQNAPHELVILSYPRNISEMEYTKFNEYLKNTIMQTDC